MSHDHGILRSAITEALENCDGNKTKAAELLMEVTADVFHPRDPDAQIALAGLAWQIANPKVD